MSLAATMIVVFQAIVVLQLNVVGNDLHRAYLGRCSFEPHEKGYTILSRAQPRNAHNVGDLSWSLCSQERGIQLDTGSTRVILAMTKANWAEALPELSLVRSDDRRCIWSCRFPVDEIKGGCW
jgi:hypothetical protein